MNKDLFHMLQERDEEDVHVSFVSAKSRGRRLLLHAEVHLLSEDVVQLWAFQCRNVFENHVRIGADEASIELTHNHCLLWQYQREIVSLYLNGQSSEHPDTIVGALYLAHFEVTQGWCDFHRWLNPAMKLPQLISLGAGLLAEGPEPIVSVYERVVQQFGIGTSKLFRGPLRPWDRLENKWMETSVEPVALVSDASWIIAESIDVSLVSR